MKNETTLAELIESDLVEYSALNSKGALILVTNKMEALGQAIKENSLESEIGGVSYQDAVNTCPCCGVLYYIEDLIQLENDIICEECNANGKCE